METYLVKFVWVAFLIRGILSNEVRGVNPGQSQFYKPQKDFTCLDGSLTIPFSLVNDDYCDCRDGSDEPGTAACPNGNFHCANVGHRPLDLLSSRVNDKICDCCDGSDEWGTDVNCPNTCEEMGRKAREEERRLEELHAQGFNRKQDYATQGKHKDEESQVLLAQKEAELVTITQELDRLAAAKDAAEEPENAAKEEHKKKWEEEKEARRVANLREDAKHAFDQLDTNSDSFVSVDELRAKYELDDNGDGEVSEEEALGYSDNLVSLTFEAFYPSVWDRIADKCQFSRPPPATEAPPQTDQEQEDGKNEVEEDDGEDEDDEDEDEDDEDLDEQNDTEEMPDYDEATKALIEKANAARDAHRDADNKKRDIDREISDLKKYLEIDYGPDREFSPLYDQCYEYTDREYTYKMCGFKKVTQAPKGGGRETSLGTWGKWGGPSNNPYSVMVFENGEKCWNGPSRSATIKISCGLEDQLLSASEPNRCEYAMDFSTPAICIPVVRKSHEEL